MTEHVGEVKVRVRYAETDQMGVVYHANYLVWFEVGRVEFLRKLGFSYREMEENDACFIAVVDARCRYRAPARYDDEIIVRTHLKNARESLVHFGYEIVRSTDGTLLAEGETTHVVTDAQMKRRTIPEKYMRAFCEAAGRNFLTTEDKKH
ncbi:MAG: acyl-CoA thioesterase [Acidobacteria bacterium]|nr:MAG: acyl-CoA thioesterase [Acidobacteriota bacterium]